MRIWITLATLALLGTAFGQDSIDNYYGQKAVPLDSKTKAPKQVMPDAFGSELFIDGKTDVALDSRSLAAQAISDREDAKTRQKELDHSVRADIASGQPITVLIAPEHFVQLSFLRDNEIVYPRRAFTGQPDLLIIDKKDNSPYVYIAASAMVEGQTTNLFVETEEDGRIQTYVINLLVTEPQNIREQVAVNLVDDRTPPIRGGEGSDDDVRTKRGYGIQGNNASAPGNPTTSTTTPDKKVIGSSVMGRFNEADVKRFFNTMIEMADHYVEAKQLEKKTGRIIYRDTDIKIYPAGRNNYIDPIEGTIWNVEQIWFFPKYDALLLDVRCKNPGKAISIWDFSQVRWQANNSPKNFSTTAAAPLSMQTLPGRTNKIWYLIQGNRLDPQAEFSPVFPRADRRGTKAQTFNPTLSRSEGK